MITLTEIEEAHRKVRSGADFPAYIRDLIEMKIRSYDTFVEDGHCAYTSDDGHQIVSSAKYEFLLISNELDKAQFQKDLKAHQDGKTDYLTFCQDAAKSGIEKWIIHMEDRSCTYLDSKGEVILVEQIPRV